MELALKRTAIATLTVASVAVLSFNSSEQTGVSLGFESAQAKTNRPSTSVAGAAPRHYRRTVYDNGMLAAAVAATTSPRNYDDYYCYSGPYVGGAYPPGYYYRSYPGGYCVSSGYATGLYARPTLFPRYYGAWSW